MKDMVIGCPAELTLQAIGGRWKIFILSRLFDDTLRFAELQRRINEVTSSSVTPKMLTQELRQMERVGLVSRHVYAQVPYSAHVRQEEPCRDSTAWLCRSLLLE